MVRVRTMVILMLIPVLIALSFGMMWPVMQL